MTKNYYLMVIVVHMLLYYFKSFRVRTYPFLDEKNTEPMKSAAVWESAVVVDFAVDVVDFVVIDFVVVVELVGWSCVVVDFPL